MIPSMFTVGVSDIRCRASVQLMSFTHFFTPMIFFAFVLFQTLGRGRINDFSKGGQRAHVFRQAFDRRLVTICTHECIEGLNQMPDRAVDSRFVRGMNILQTDRGPISRRWK